MSLVSEDVSVLVPPRAIALLHDIATKVHQHHAYKVAIAVDGRVRLGDGRGATRCGPVAVVGPNTPHEIAIDGAGLVMFVEPEHFMPVPSMTQPGSRAVEALQRIGHESASDLARGDTAAMVVNEVVKRLSGDVFLPETRARWDRRIHHAFELLSDRPQPLDSLAHATGLSRFRLSHLFKDQVGVSIRRYGLWARVKQAVIYHAHQGQTLTAAAHQAGFADQAHFTRAFVQMFGVPPSRAPRSKNVQA